MTTERSDHEFADTLTCKQTLALLPAHLEQGLSATQRRAVQAHLKTCSSCRYRYQNEANLASRLGHTLPRKRQEPTAATTWRIRHRIEHRLRRDELMTRTRQMVWGTTALVVLAVVVGVFAWWQANDLPAATDPTRQAQPTETNVDRVAVPGATAQIPTRIAANSDAPPGEQQVVQLALYDFQEEVYAPALAAFEEENPDIDVRIVYIQDILPLDGGQPWPTDAVERLAANADVSGFFTGLENAQRGLILDLRPFMETDPSISVDDFYPSALEAFQWQGGIWGIPTELNYELIFFQKSAFDAAGVPYPAPGWTWDEFLAAAKALTHPGGQWGFVMPLSESLSLIQARGGPVWDSRFSPPQILFDTPAIIEATQWYTDLYLVHEVSPYLRTPQPDASGSFSIPGYDLVLAGEAAMWTDSSGSWIGTRNSFRNRGIDIGAAPMPVSQPDDRTTLYNTTNALGISAGTQNAQAAWRLISFLSRQELYSTYYEEPSYLPARRSVAQANGFWEQVDPDLGAALQYAVDHSFYPGRVPLSLNEAEAIVVDMFRNMLSGDTPVEAALVSAQAQLDALAAEEELARQQATPAPVTVVTPAPEVVLAEGDVAITFVADTYEAGMVRTLQELAQQFREQNPTRFVDVQPPPSGGINPSTIRQVAQTSDCMLWQNPSLPAENRDLLLALDPLLEAGTGLSREDFFPLALTPLTVEGQLWGLPAWVNVTVLAYDKQLFDAAGVPYPTAGWTIQQFQEAALALTQGDGAQKQFGFLAAAYEAEDLVPMLERAGATLVDDAANPPRAAFDDPSTVAAMRWYVALSTDYGAKPLFNTAPNGLRGQGERDIILSDRRAAMWTDHAGSQLVGHLGDHVGYAPLPAAAAVASPGSQSTAAYFISAGTDADQRQTCWEWITFLSQQPQAALAGLPARRDVAASPAYLELAGAERAAAYRATVEGSSQPDFYTRVRLNDDWGWLSLAWYWLADAYHRAVTEGVPVESALQEAQISADAYRACLLARFEVFGPDLDCLREVDPQLAEQVFGRLE